MNKTILINHNGMSYHSCNLYITMTKLVTLKNLSLLVLISLWLIMGDYRQVFWLIYSSHIAVFLWFALNLWKFNSTGFDICCKSWNIAVCKLMHIPFNTHVWILGPLIKQNILRVQLQLQFRNLQFLLNAFNSTNDTVKTCIQSSMYTSNTCIGYKLSFYRYKYSLDMHDSYTASMKIISGQNLSEYQSSTVNNWSTLSEMRSGNNFVNVFYFIIIFY